MEHDLASIGFRCLRGRSAKILRLLCALLDHTTGGRVRHGPKKQNKDV
jgi:hypothetical protein